MFKWDRNFYIPKEGATEMHDEQSDAVCYTYERAGVLYALAFVGKQAKPLWHYRYKSAENRQEAITKCFEGRRATLAYKAERTASRHAFRHTLKVGDVLRSSWGYDQTNVDFYQVVALKGETQVTVRKIAHVSETTGMDCGKCAPDVGNFLEREKPMTCRVQQGNSIKVRDWGAYAHLMAPQEAGGLKVYGSTYWSSYA
jgi:hypothetical protein